MDNYKEKNCKEQNQTKNGARSCSDIGTRSSNTAGNKADNKADNCGKNSYRSQSSDSADNNSVRK